MTDSENSQQSPGRPVSGELRVSAESDAQVSGTVVDGRAAGQQGFSREQSQHELKASREAHKHRLAQQRLESELREAERTRNMAVGCWESPSQRVS